MTKRTESRVKREKEKIILFHKLFEQCLPLTKTVMAAYFLAEDMHKATGATKPFYKNYISFKTSRRYYFIHKGDNKRR